MDDFEDDKDIYTTKAVYEPDTGRFLYQTTLLNGLKHAPPDGSPSYISRNPQGSTWMVWHAFDKEHRTDGPSTVITHPNSDIPKTEVFRVEGRPRPASEGSYRIRRNEQGEIWKEEFRHDDDQKLKLSHDLT